MSNRPEISPVKDPLVLSGRVSPGGSVFGTVVGAFGETNSIDLSNRTSYVQTKKQIQLENRADKLQKAKSMNSEMIRGLLSQAGSSTRRLLSQKEPDNMSTDTFSQRSNDDVVGSGRFKNLPTYGSTHVEENVGLSVRSILTEHTNLDGTMIKIPEIEKKEDDDDYDDDDDNDKSKAEATSTLDVLMVIFFGKGIISCCLLAIPFALASVYFKWSPTWVFWLNFIVLIPLASILGDFTEEVSLHTNETIGGLINASFGNAVEVVIAVQALLANEIRVVQASMLGSILSNLLLVLGSCFFFGGLFHKEQSFNATAATANMGLLALSSIALVLPTPFAEYYDLHSETVLEISRIAAVFLIFMYIQLLIFQLRTHTYLFDGGNNDDDEELATISFGVACFGLLAVTCMVALFSEYLVNSIEGFTEASGVSRTFVGIIILPIVGNAVEHVTAVTVSIKNKMDLAMGIAVGSCTQISLFVAPLSVIVGWMLGKEMTLNFTHFEIALYILSIFTVSVVCSNPVCNWLEGSLLITTYALLAVGFWFEDVKALQA